MISLIGMAALVLCAVALSRRRGSIRWSVVLRALALQAMIGWFVLRLSWGRRATETLSHGVTALLDSAGAGIDMVFGPLAGADVGFSFALGVLPVIVFFASLMSVLYHLGVMQVVVRLFGGTLCRLVGVSRNEALNSAANVFVGLTEAPLVIRPYLSGLSDAQLFCVMVAGLASVAGSVLGAYASLGVRVEYLLAAAFMAAPGGLAMSKLVLPDATVSESAHDSAKALADSPELSDLSEFPHPPQLPEAPQAITRHDNVVVAAAQGAADGLRLAVHVGAMLLAFVSLIALANRTLSTVGAWLGADQLSVQTILGVAFAPVLWLLGVPWSEAELAGSLFGEKLVLNEFVAFTRFAEVAETLSPTTQGIVTFALCGFANLAAIAVLLGGLGGLVPERRATIGRLGLLAVLTASLANLMSAGMVGLLLAL